MKKILLLVIFAPLTIMAQNNGIQFEKDLTWEQVKAKAKKKNKYIFLDCYATWCGPCQRMDKEVYTNDAVGDFFNKNFISVKIQMDETDNDTKEVELWRNEVKAMAQKYKIKAYPTYVFLTPEGDIVHMETGFRIPSDFVAVAQVSTAPGKVYNNPYATYDQLVMEYWEGKKNYSKMPYIVKTALELNEIEVAKTVARDYSNYVIGLDDDKLYTKENIEFFTTVISSKSKFFHLFFPNGSKIDAAMNKKGYAENIVDEVILREDVEPFIQLKIGGMQIMGAKPEARPEPDWEVLHQKISSKYTFDYAKRNVLEAQIAWYQHQQNPIFAAYFVQRWEQYGLDTTSEKVDLRLNEVAWYIFKEVSDGAQINTAINWMQGVVRRSTSIAPSWRAATIDTYACLLYKIGKKEEAIEWEEQTLNGSDPTEIAEFRDRVNQMKKGEQIWPPDSN